MCMYVLELILIPQTGFRGFSSSDLRFIGYALFSSFVIMTAVTKTESASSPSFTCEKNRFKLDLFAFDFDGTCTVDDTTKLFYKATNKYRQSSDVDSRNLDNQWKELEKTYLSGHMETVSRSLTNYTGSENCGLNLKGLRLFLQAVHDFESEISIKVEQSGLLKGISKLGILSVSDAVKLNPGCFNVLSHVNSPLNTISVNWSEDLIYSRLGHLKYLKILANNFPVEDELSTGEIGHSISTAFDKERVFQQLAHQYSEPGVGITVFIGDSIVDLLALLDADVGVVFGKSTTLRKVTQAFGINLLPIQHLSRSVTQDDCHSLGYPKAKPTGELYEATSWNDIGFSLFGSHYTPNKYETV